MLQRPPLFPDAKQVGFDFFHGDPGYHHTVMLLEQKNGAFFMTNGSLALLNTPSSAVLIGLMLRSMVEALVRGGKRMLDMDDVEVSIGRR